MEGRVVEGWEVLVRMVLQVRNACGSAAPAECGSPRRIGDATRAFATGRVDGSRGCGASGEGGIRTPERGQPPLRDFQSRPFNRSGTSPGCGWSVSPHLDLPRPAA